MNLLDTDYGYDDLRRWGALEIYPEAQVRAWFGTRPRLSIGETLKLARIRPSILFWVVLRAELVDERLLHGLAVDLAEALLARLRSEGHYIDFRTERVLLRKRAWIARQISLGELSVARQRAMQARGDVSEIDDPAVWIGAKAAVQASVDDGRTAITDVYYTALEHDASRAHQRAIVDGVRASLGEARDHWSMGDSNAVSIESR
jgi:hypothetical protein